MNRKRPFYFGQKVSSLAVATSLLLILISGCSLKEIPSPEFDAPNNDIEQNELTERQEVTTPLPDKPSEVSKEANGASKWEPPDDVGKGVIMEKYGITEELYDNYLEGYERSRASAKNPDSVMFEDYIETMEIQRAVHEDPSHPLNRP